MSARHVWVLAILASFCYGYGGRESRLQAADPAACQKYKCKTIYCKWRAGYQTIVGACKQVGGNANSNSAALDIFTVSSTETTPTAANGQYDYWLFASCNPTCGKDAGGNWQADQEVIPTGMGENGGPIDRNVCTAAAGGNGDLSTDQSNSNTVSPPGYTTGGLTP